MKFQPRFWPILVLNLFRCTPGGTGLLWIWYSGLNTVDTFTQLYRSLYSVPHRLYYVCSSMPHIDLLCVFVYATAFVRNGDYANHVHERARNITIPTTGQLLELWLWRACYWDETWNLFILCATMCSEHMKHSAANNCNSCLVWLNMWCVPHVPSPGWPRQRRTDFSNRLTYLYDIFIINFLWFIFLV